MASGDEERNGSWADSRRRYDASYGIRKADDLAAVTAFFEARRGRLYGFRWKDWADNKSGLPSAGTLATDQPIGTGNGATTAFQLVKLYTSGAQSWTRTITKPVAGTVTLALNGVTQITSWTVNTSTGVVSFAAAPAAGVAITAGFEFDVPVRFDTDTLDVSSGDSWVLVEVPLGESTDAYDLEILNGAAVVRTVSGLATASFLHTAAMMVADFGGPVTTLRFRVYQIGALGRGAAAEALV
jgi:uncharacterized protein (TIGR02217 family)